MKKTKHLFVLILALCTVPALLSLLPGCSTATEEKKEVSEPPVG